MVSLKRPKMCTVNLSFLKLYRDHYQRLTVVFKAFKKSVIYSPFFKTNLDRSILRLSIENIKTLCFYGLGLEK
jgi:hypothetical protein